MNTTRSLAMLGTYLSLACSGLLLGAGCVVTDDFAEAPARPTDAQACLEVEAPDPHAPASLFQIETDAQAAIARIVVDIHDAETGEPMATDFDVTHITEDQWTCFLSFLPRNTELHFVASAYDTEGKLILQGETHATLADGDQHVSLALAPIQRAPADIDLPRLQRIVYPAELEAGQEIQFLFTFEGKPGATMDYRITSENGAAAFSPATGSVTFTDTTADFVALHTTPEVTEATEFDHEILLTLAGFEPRLQIATRFTTTVIPRSTDIEAVIAPRIQAHFEAPAAPDTADAPAASTDITAVHVDIAHAESDEQCKNGACSDRRTTPSQE